MIKPLEKFQNLLRELFQFDCADVDFGIYRIMNHKRDVIERFITNDLPKAVADELKRGALADQSQAAGELQDVAEQIKETLGADALNANGNLAETYHATPLGKRYLSLKAKATGARGREAIQASIFNHLYAFCSHYYQDGDFISKRRYSKRQKYAIPYNGEEVYLYWANHDQYYVKTAEHFTDYTFTSGGVTIHFKLYAADVEQNNVKGEKRFFLPRFAEIVWDEAARQLVIPFEYRPLTEQENIAYGQKNQQETIIAEALEKIPKRLSPKTAAPTLADLTAEKRKNSDGQPVTFLEHHLRQYIQRNTSDFFIHKALKGFLSRELDFYLKNEVLNVDEMEASGEDRAEGWFQMMRVIKAVGGRIIEFLAQIENFQKMLWEKRKFITETQYCITVGNISEDFYPEIAECAAQWEEWMELFHIDEEQADLFPVGKSKKHKRIEFLKSRPTLVLDTKHFAQSFVDRLTGSFEDLDGMTDGLLIHSENWQALNLLTEKYREKVKCIYIDPPYNTASSAIPYKNDYKHSSFASMMYDRLEGLWRTLTKNGAIFVSIDKTERTVLQQVLDGVFGTDSRIEELVWAMNTNNSQAPNYSTNHEYMLVYAKERAAAEQDRNMFREPKPGYAEVMELVSRLNADYPPIAQIQEALRQLYDQHKIAYREEVEAQGLAWEEEERNNTWKGLYPYSRAEYRDAEAHLVPEAEARAMQACIWIWQEGDISMPATKQSLTTRDPKHKNYRFYRPLHRVTGKPCPHPKSGWKFAYDDDEDRRSFKSLDRDGRIEWGPDETKVPRLKRMLHEVETNVGKSVFSDYSDGEKQTSAMFGRSGVFLAPKHANFISRFIRHGAKSDSIILDCFGGSDSTAHAVISLNRSDRGRRKYILIEMADYFDTVLKPRVLKAVYSPDWRAGKPKRMATAEEAERSPRIVKYLRLESYEDALNNIAFDASGQAMQFDDYLLSYMLKWETRASETLLNVEKLARPFRYKLHIHTEGQTCVKLVDVPETFNYLLGLHVQTRRVYDDGGRRYLVYHGRIDHRQIAVIWRETEGWQKADFERDKQFVTAQKLIEGADEVFVNGDSFIPNGRALEPVFKARMFAPVEA